MELPLCALMLCLIASSTESSDLNPDISLSADVTQLLETLTKTMETFDKRLEDLAHHQLSQDVYTGERLRHEGQSGIKQVRVRRGGTRTYYIAGHTSERVAGMHEHANFRHVLGLGEVVAVLNGVEFTTRHNDFHLVKPSTESTDFLATELITPPAVPPRVLELSSVDDQITEMREWFRAWRDQDHSVRDYREHFKPVLCYLEGAWFYPDQIPVDMIHSDRHHISSEDFHHLQTMHKFTSDSGRKQPQENLSFLPRSVQRVVNGTPEFAQWNYRVLCQPLKDDLPLNRFRVVDDLASRMTSQNTFPDYSSSMKARYQLNPYDSSSFTNEKPAWFGLPDTLMAQVPGFNNHGGNLTDNSFGSTAYQFDRDQLEPVNMAYYNRWLKAKTLGAFGQTARHRGFSDDNLYVAQTTQPAVVPTELEYCTGNGNRRTCEWQSYKFSYAIPLEVVYMTPLTEWNPYDIEYKGSVNTPLWQSVRDGGRNGNPTATRAYNGTNHITFFQTPDEFYAGGEVASDPADTTGQGATAVLDKNEDMRMVRDSGYRMFLPEITGVGILRQRYPIMQVNGEGSSVWKELEALKDIVMDSNDNKHMYRQQLILQNPDEPTNTTDNPNTNLMLRLEAGTAGHIHLVSITPEQLQTMQNGTNIDTVSGESDGHTHTMTVRLRQGLIDQFFASNIRPAEGHENRLSVV